MMIFIILILIIIFLVFGILRTIQTQTTPDQKIFLTGKVPKNLPNGFLKGTVNIKTTWAGKEFDSKTKTGINIFRNGDQRTKNYPFKTYIGKGAQDRNLEVIKIDYNLSQNPIWLRFILDEIVETKPNHYLGKLNLRILPNLAFSLGFFRLEKN